MKSKELQQQITERILEALKQGKKPWQQPWLSANGFPRNILTCKPYRGINVLSCILHAGAFGHPTALYASYRQWQGKGCQVRKGEKGVHIVYYGRAEGKVNEDGEKGKGFMFLKNFVAFNLAQVDGEYADKRREQLAAAVIAQKPDTLDPDVRSKADKLLAQATVEHGGSRACYNQTSDKIQLPHPENFKSWYGYYATSNHELVHWSGAESRLNRLKAVNRFGSMAYAFEELVAEIGGCYLSASIGLPVTEQLENHTSYLDHWVSILANDETAIIKAASLASAASDYCRKGAGLDVTEEEAEEAEEAEAVTA